MAKSTKKSENPGWFRFITSKVFFVNLALAMVFIAVVVWLTLGAINRYSRHSQSQTVPDLTGMSSKDAQELLESADLEFAVMDSSYLADAKPLSILSQDPKPGSLVKSGRSIYVVVNRLEPPPTEIPYIEKGTSYISVLEILQSRGLKVGNVSYKPFQYKDVFIDMRIRGKSGSAKPGTKVAKGTVIDLTLGNGLGETKVNVPNLIGYGYMEAVSLIQLKDLNVGTIIANGTITDTLSAFIIRQFPEGNDSSVINMGSMIDLWISDTPPVMNDPEPEE